MVASRTAIPPDQSTKKTRTISAVDPTPAAMTTTSNKRSVCHISYKYHGFASLPICSLCIPGLERSRRLHADAPQFSVLRPKSGAHQTSKKAVIPRGAALTCPPAMTSPSWRKGRGSPATSHIRSVRSDDPVTTRPSALNATLVTPSECPLSSRRNSPVGTFHNRAV